MCIYIYYVIQVVLSSEEQFQLQENDRMGWTFTSAIGAITFDYLHGQDVKFMYLEGVGDLMLNQAYDFSDFVLPAVFSVAVEVDTRKLMIY